MTEKEYDDIAEFMYRLVDKEEPEEKPVQKLPVSMIRSEQEIRYALFSVNPFNLDKRTLLWVLYEEEV